jgi:4,5-DOPA dioxygenase extradiol
MTRMPAVFVSHGSPMLAIEDGSTHRFLTTYAATLDRPKAILVASAHWLTAEPTVSLARAPRTIHDFGRFADELFALNYAAPGAPKIARTAWHLLGDAGISVAIHPDRGLDHGAWIPLRLLYPQGDIPVAQLSIQPEGGSAHHFQVGRALRPLRDDGVLIVGSGGLTHNLKAFFANSADAETPVWAEAFSTWVLESLTKGSIEDLLTYRARAPFAVQNHPTEEHLLPLFVALGAGSDEIVAERLHAGFMSGVLGMDAYAFH